MKKTPERKALEKLVSECEDYLVALDAVMVQPSTVKRGQEVGKLSNWLNIRVDMVRYSALGIDYRKDKPLKERVKARRLAANAHLAR